MGKKKFDEFESYYKDLLWRGVSYMKMGWKKHSRQRYESTMSGEQQAGGCEWHFSSREGGRAKEATRDQVIPGYEDLITCGEQFGLCSVKAVGSSW